MIGEVEAALVPIATAAGLLEEVAALLDGVTYRDPTDDPDDEPRDAYHEATNAAGWLEDALDGLLDRVRRTAWLHDLDHARVNGGTR